MSEDRQTYSSFGDPNAQPPTPQQTPNSATFASPVFETPKHPQGSFSEPGGLTPRFAEDYSVFNATPGNLRGTHGPFAEFAPATPSSVSGHKRFLSTESAALEIASHTNHFSPNPNAPLPPVDPSRRLASSPNLATPPHKEKQGFNGQSQGSPILARTRSSKKVRRGTLEKESEQTQVLSPPPTAKKRESKLAPKLKMQHDQSFGQPDFHDASQSNEMVALMGNPGDMFSYPLSAPAGGPAHFWDPAMSMDLDFSQSNGNMFQSPALGHRQTGSFDWNNNIQLFQDPNQPSSSNQENMHPGMQHNSMIATQQMTNHASAAMNNCSVPAAYSAPMEDPFSMMVPGEALDPGLLLSRPQSAAMDTAFDNISPTDGSQSVPPKQVGRGTTRKGNKASKVPDRSFASSPIKSSRPSLSRSFSENRGRKALNRASLPALAPATRNSQQSSGTASNNDAARSIGRSGGRVSPLKSQRRLSGLASIPEAPFRAQRRASVRFTIDSQGRARAEMADDTSKSISRSQSSRDLSFGSKWAESDDESTDEEPIIIPSRNNSFASSSFALPDPRKPVGSIFSRRSASNSASNSEAGETRRVNDAESDAETVLNDERDGDAANELRKVMQNRQKRGSLVGKGHPQRLLTNIGHFQDGTISPSSLTESGYGTDGQGVRCICNRSGMGEGDGFMVQCESCEMLLHGHCLNITKRSMPSVYICRFCANTANFAGHDDPRHNALGIAPAISPLANKSFHSFR